MHTNKRILPVMLALMVFTACENAHKDIDITLQTNHSELVAAIENMDKSLSEKLQLIQAAVTGGFADQAEAQELLRQAVASLSGTLEEKLSAIGTALKSQTAGLEVKLGLIEAAVSGGFADAKAQQALIQSTLGALNGSLEEKLSAVETSLKSQTLSLETKLGLIETAIKENLVSEKTEEDLIIAALETLSGTLDEQLKTLEKAVSSQASGLSAKLGLIEAAITKGLTGTAEALSLMQQAVATLEGTASEKLSAIGTAIKSQTASLEIKLGLIKTAVAEGLAGTLEQQELLSEAVDALNGTAETRLAAIKEVIESQDASLSSKLGLIETALRKGLTTRQEKQDLIRQALAALNGTLDEKLAAVDTAMLRQTDSLTTKLGVIVAELETKLADEATVLGQLKTAVITIAATLDDPDAAYSVASAIDSINTRLVADGAIGKALSDLLDAVQGLNYKEALTMLARALQDVAFYLVNYTGHPYVEMGDGLKWATCNVNAANPWEIGGYFAFGETKTKELYSNSTYKFYESIGNNFYRQTRYWTKGETLATYGYIDDAARQNWGGRWRVPSRAEWDWLIAHCTWAWSNSNGTQGVLVTSKEPGHESSQLFLPAGGYQEVNLDGTPLLSCRDTAGFYWTSDIVEDWGDPGRVLFEKGSGTGHPKVMTDYSALIWTGLLVRPVAN